VSTTWLTVLQPSDTVREKRHTDTYVDARETTDNIRKAIRGYECAIHYPKITRIVGRLNRLDTI